MPEYLLAISAREYQAAATLFSEYAAGLGIDLSFQHFDEELAELQQMYSAPNGGIILCRENGDFIGCVAIRMISDDIGELKRMFVQPRHQGNGIGKILLDKAIALAKELNYQFIRLDTLNYMEPAMELYKKYGFYEIEAYYHNPNTTAVYFEKKL